MRTRRGIRAGLGAHRKSGLLLLLLLGCGEAADSPPKASAGAAGSGAGSGGSAAGGASGQSGSGGLLVDAGGGSGGGAAGEPASCDQAKTSRTYVGCEFWPTVTYNPVYPSFSFAVAVANGGAQPADVQVTRGSTAVTSATVQPGSLSVLPLPWVTELKGPHFDGQTTGARVHDSIRVDAGAYRLTSSVPVSVWQFNPLEYEQELSRCTVPPQYGDNTRCLSVSNDAALLLPTAAMTGAYRLFGRSATNGGEVWGSTPGAFAITATSDSTSVRVQLSAGLAAGPGVASGTPGQTLTFSMNAGDVVELLGSWGPFWGDKHADLSGSVVLADKPVQIISTNPLSNVPDEATGFADHLEETVLPAEALGKRYLVAAPSAPDAKVVGHLVRLYGSVDGTKLAYPAGMPAGAPTTLAAGQVVELGPIPDAFEVSADQPFAVASLMLGGQRQDPTGTDVETRGDPAFSMLVAPEQFRKSYTFLAPPDYLENYADIVTPTGTVLTLDGSPANGTESPIGSSGWSVVRVRLGAGNQGAHRLEANQAVGLQVMGFGHATAYYYPGGLNVTLIAPPPVIR